MNYDKLSPEASKRLEERTAEIIRIGNRAVHKAQEENRWLGIPNVYSINGVVTYELLDKTLSKIDPMTDYHSVDVASGLVIAANHKRRVRFGSGYAIVLHNRSVSTVDREQHKVALDLLSDSSTFPEATTECQMIIDRIFSSSGN